MEKKKVNVIYDANGKAVRVQMDFDLYQWLLDLVSQAEKKHAMAH